MPRSTPIGFTALVLVMSAVACGGSHQAGDANWTPEPPQENRPLRDTESLGQPPAALSEPDGGSRAPLGVRHDLMIAPSTAHSAKCTCLAVEAGAANDPKFQWQNGAPDVGDAMVVAVSAHGVQCPGGEADETKRRASISAVDREGPDVLVEIEEVPEGRPIASGAIIPRPGAGGSLYVRPKNGKVPYARPAAGSARCKVM